MVFFIILIITVTLSILGRFLLKRWFNHLTIYSVIWGGMIFLYEMKLLSYYELGTETWIVIILSTLTYILGILLYTVAHNTFGREKELIYLKNHLKNEKGVLFNLVKDDGKILKYSIIIMGIIGLGAALQHWYVLFKMFGSLAGIIINANIIYRMRVNGELKGVIPYLHVFAYSAVFLSAIYSAHKNKITFVGIFPFIAVILKELANVGRAGILFSMLVFIITFVFSRYVFYYGVEKEYQKTNKGFIIAILFILTLSIVGASIVRNIRGTYESFAGESHQLTKLKGNYLITPSLYLYLSSDIGVLNKYLLLDEEHAKFGQNTFLTVYSVLSKFDVVKKPNTYQRGYRIPMWTNTGTYLRELHADFGAAGLFVGPFLIGFITTIFFFKFFEKKKSFYLLWLVYFYVIIFFSFLVIITRVSIWTIGITILIFTIPLIEKLALKNYERLSLKK